MIKNIKLIKISYKIKDKSMKMLGLMLLIGCNRYVKI